VSLDKRPVSSLAGWLIHLDIFVGFEGLSKIDEAGVLP
jgi:hypothetical protein